LFLKQNNKIQRSRLKRVVRERKKKRKKEKKNKIEAKSIKAI